MEESDLWGRVGVVLHSVRKAGRRGRGEGTGGATMRRVLVEETHKKTGEPSRERGSREE